MKSKRSGRKEFDPMAAIPVEWSGTSQKHLHLGRNNTSPTSASHVHRDTTPNRYRRNLTRHFGLDSRYLQQARHARHCPRDQADEPLQLSRPLGPAPSTRRKHWIRLEPPTSSPEGFANESSTADRYRLNRPNQQWRQPPKIPCDLLFWVVWRYLLANDPRRTPKHPKTSPRHLIRQSPCLPRLIAI